MNNTLYIGWTTCRNQDVAERLANDLVERKLAACVQIESIQSIYTEDERVVNQVGLRLTVKFLGVHLQQIKAYILANHPDAKAEWITVKAENVNTKYLQWVQRLS
jgi:periplasmic divalent cation tolerance protein